MFDHLEQLFLNAVATLLPGIDLKLHTSTLQRTPEDGGLGFMPVATIRDSKQADCVLAAEKYLSWFDLKMTSGAEQKPGVKSKPIRYIWRANTPTQHLAYDRDGKTFLRGEGFVSFADLRPTNKYTKISDEVYRHHVNVMLRNIQPFQGMCHKDPDHPIAFTDMSAEEFTHHAMACNTCVKVMHYQRHEAVLHAIRDTMRFHGLSCYVPNFSELPLPGNDKGGPDLVVNSRVQPDAVDVSCVCVNYFKNGEKFTAEMKARFDEKNKKYKQFGEDLKYNIIPFIMSHLGVVCRETREIVKPWRDACRNPQFPYDLYANTQMALIRAQYNMFVHFQHSHDKKLFDGIKAK
jgi:hypothetical protein